ncbi:MAG: tRNA lysidine(34) synthetase TilS [Candidatus Omnitrophota bacterium]|nr:tRNA lysidine(34) synthetase TilS [Candidatus Omnitrophota bacterium]
MASLEEQGLVSHKRKVFVACSGGPDSVALLHLLRSLGDPWKLKLGILHLNHGLRGAESDREQKFVAQLARAAGIPFYTAKKKIRRRTGNRSLSLEESARNVRYDFFTRVAKKHRIPVIALAHNQDDQAETMLMRILQGTGLRGLSGIRPVVTHRGIRFVRPLLNFTKKEVLGYLRSEKVRFCIDSSNRSKKFLRNRIRLDLLPHLSREYNPRVTQALARIPAIVRGENEVLEAVDRAAWRRVVLSRRGGSLYLDRQALLKFPAAVQFRIVNRALQKIDPRSGLNYQVWQGFQGHLTRPRSRSSFPRDIDISINPLSIRVYKRFGRP